MADRVVISNPPRFRAVPRLRTRTLLIIAGPIALVTVSLWLYLSGGRYVSTDNAYVQADMVALSTDVSGIVKSVDVTDNAHVAAGQVLFRLDDQPFRYAVELATAELGQAEGDVAAMKADYRAHVQEIQRAQVDVDFARRDWARRNDLFSQHVVSQSAMDQAQEALDSAQRQLGTAQQQADSIAAHLNHDPNLPAEQNPKVRVAQAQLDQAKLNLDHTVVRAPVAGIVTNVPSLQVGRYLPASTAAFSLIADNTTYIEANPKETQLTWVRVGQPATVKVDSYPGIEWSCSVASLSPASGSQFALLPAQNTSGNWVKVVQRIPIRINCPPASDKPLLRAGMSTVVSIDTGHQNSMHELLGSVGL
jgi:membrane fusion protein (multidrug efflux system)